MDISSDEEEDAGIALQVVETDADWLNFHNCMSPETLPQGWTVQQGQIWLHEPKRILCEALHKELEPIDEKDWGKGPQKQ